MDRYNEKNEKNEKKLLAVSFITSSCLLRRYKKKHLPSIINRCIHIEFRQI